MGIDTPVFTTGPKSRLSSTLFPLRLRVMWLYVLLLWSILFFLLLWCLPDIVSFSGAKIKQKKINLQIYFAFISLKIKYLNNILDIEIPVRRIAEYCFCIKWLSLKRLLFNSYFALSWLFIKHFFHFFLIIHVGFNFFTLVHRHKQKKRSDIRALSWYILLVYNCNYILKLFNTYSIPPDNTGV